MSSGTSRTSGTSKAWAWHDHLLAGGVTPWAAFSGESTRTDPDVPGAQQLELLRRLNLAGPVTSALATAVLSANAPGRGRPELELIGAGSSSGFGSPAIDPIDLPDQELLRVAVSVIADQLLASAMPSPEVRPKPRPWRRGYRLLGDPELAAPRRAELRRRGFAPSGRAPRAVVLGTDLATMVGHAWTARCFSQGATSWPHWLAHHEQRNMVPPSIDLPRIASAWAARLGHESVHIVLDPAAVPALVGVRALPLVEVRAERAAPVVEVRAERASKPRDSSVAAAELARRVAALLGLLVTPERRTQLLRDVLRPRLPAIPVDGLAVPAEYDDWLASAATKMRDDLRRAGYAVHGDLDALIPTPSTGGELPSTRAALQHAIALLVGDSEVRA